MKNQTNYDLDKNLRAVESDLSEMSPHSLSQDLLARMDSELSRVADFDSDLDHVDVVGDGLGDLEIRLSQLSPSVMPEDMLARMSDAMDRWQDFTPSEEKVVAFAPQKRHKKSGGLNGGMLSAAAAVALLGAVAALAWPQVNVKSSPSVAQATQSASTVVMNNPSLQSTPVGLESSVMGASSVSAMPSFATNLSSNVQPVTFTTDALTHKVVGTQDRGVVLSKQNVPHRCIRIEYVDRIKGTDAQGRKIEVETPGVDFMLIPIETN